MDRWAGKVVVITGASAGIGLATAKALVQNGMIVIGLSRRVEKMQTEMGSAKGPGKFYAKACDVTNENDVIQTFQWIEKNFKTVHVLVNNAGTLKEGPIAELKTEDIQHTINVNIMGLLYCTRQALKSMKRDGHDAHIVNINSVAGHKVPFFGDVNLNIYPATKYAVTATCESLIKELKDTRIRITSISPGVVKTEIFGVAHIDASVLKEMPALNAEDIASSIVHVIAAPHHVQITELTIIPLGQVQ